MMRSTMLSSSLVTALILFLVCGPVQAANLVGTSDIADGAVTNPKIAVGAVTLGKLGSDVEARFAQLEVTIAALQVENAEQQNALGLLEQVNSQQQVEISTLQSTLNTLQSRLATVEGNRALKLGEYVDVETGTVNDLAGPHVIFSGVNLHLTSGSGYTDGANGLGNLIIGYNEPYQYVTGRTGSHNLVIGAYNNYSSFAGIVAGTQNAISGPYASVLAGHYNWAKEYLSIVSGGSGNRAWGVNSSIAGGNDHTASGPNSSITGGQQNTASGTYATVSGGNGNNAIGDYASVTGGTSNYARGSTSTITGGIWNFAEGLRSVISGGNSHTVYGEYDWQAGGLFQDQ